MGLIKLITQVLKDNVASAAVISRRLSSRVVTESTLKSDALIRKHGGEQEILEAFDRVESLERRIFGRSLYDEDNLPLDSLVRTEQKQPDNQTKSDSN